MLKDWNIATVTPVPYDTTGEARGNYHLAGGLLLESMYPIVQGYKNTQAAGFRVNLSDPLELNRLTLAASYFPVETLANSERVHLFASYERYDWKLKASLNNADFYDLFGPTKLGRKGYSVRLEHKTVLLYDEPKRLDLTVGGSYMGNLDRLPAYQNVAVAVTRMGSLDAKLNFTNVRGSMTRSMRRRAKPAHWPWRSTAWTAATCSAPTGRLTLGCRCRRTFLVLAAQRRRFLPERREQPVRELLLRGVRQQLGGLADQKRYGSL